MAAMSERYLVRATPVAQAGVPERVAIELETHCLRRLLKAGQLHVEDFSCCDARSKECVRCVLLQALTQADTQTLREVASGGWADT